MKMLVPQSHLTLCDPVDYSPPGSSVHGILQSKILEWVAIHFPKGVPVINPVKHSRVVSTFLTESCLLR